MEITLEAIISFIGLFVGGGAGAFFTWRWQKKKAKAETVDLGRPPIEAEYLDGAPPAVRMAEAMRYYEMYMESIDLISKTVYCKTFFYRYGFALENAQKIHRLSKGLDNEAAAKDMYDVLVREKTNIVNDFLYLSASLIITARGI